MTTVLLVEDDEQQCILYKMVLECEGYYVISATTGSEGLAKLASCAADIVVMDVGLPDMDGIEVLRRMRSTRPDMPIVVNTAYAGYWERSDAVAWDRVICVLKSSDLGELKESIKQALRLPTQDGGATKGDR